jgi:hypothetical protein
VANNELYGRVFWQTVPKESFARRDTRGEDGDVLDLHCQVDWSCCGPTGMLESVFRNARLVKERGRTKASWDERIASGLVLSKRA